jgi:multicomponent Na+:H+ antiporter subunit A
VVIRHRMSAVLCLGAVGVGMALLFVLQGAPDLALTQLGVDIIGAVVFVLVLRHLPALFFERPTVTGRTFRLLVSILVGVVVFAFIVISGGARVADPVSLEFLARALEEGGGRNVVNIVVIDIRGFDTLGEITVLTVAAMGVYALARLSRNESGTERSFAPARRRWRRSEHAPQPEAARQPEEVGS